MSRWRTQDSAVVRVLVLFHDAGGSGEWTPVDLIDQGGGRWSGAGAADRRGEGVLRPGGRRRRQRRRSAPTRASCSSPSRRSRPATSSNSPATRSRVGSTGRSPSSSPRHPPSSSPTTSTGPGLVPYEGAFEVTGDGVHEVTALASDGTTDFGHHPRRCPAPGGHVTHRRRPLRHRRVRPGVVHLQRRRLGDRVVRRFPLRRRPAAHARRRLVHRHRHRPHRQTDRGDDQLDRWRHTGRRHRRGPRPGRRGFGDHPHRVLGRLRRRLRLDRAPRRWPARHRRPANAHLRRRRRRRLPGGAHGAHRRRPGQRHRASRNSPRSTCAPTITTHRGAGCRRSGRPVPADHRAGARPGHRQRLPVRGPLGRRHQRQLHRSGNAASTPTRRRER